MKNIFTIEQQNQIIEMYQNGIDVDNIVNYFNVEEHYIRIVLKEHQVDRHYNTLSDEIYERIIRYHKNGMLHKDISYNLLVSATGINKTLDRNNIPRMSYSDRNRRYYRNQHYFDIIDTPNKAYILGILYADGNNHTSHYSISLHLQKEDVSVLEQIKSELEYKGPIRENNLSEKNPNHKDQRVLVINDEYISKQLEKLGVVNAKSLILKFPEWLDSNLYSHFIRGYFDGDGCIYYDIKRNKCRCSIAGTKEMCTYIQNILKELNCKTNIYHPKQCGEHNTYILQTAGNKSSYQLLSWLYQDAEIKMERKYLKYLDFCKKYDKVA